MPKRRAVIVAGMHRSGTSAIARLLMLLGASPPENIMPARPGNEAGHWEPERVVQLNDELLFSAGLAWDDVEPFPSSWYRSAHAPDFRQRAIDLLGSEYGDSFLFVLKDPRICRIVPFWRSVLQAMQVEPAFVIPIRNPLEVAASLKARDGLSPSTGLLLWLRHVLDAEHQTRGERRVTLSYEDLLRDWRAVAQTIAESLATPRPDVAHRTEEEIEQFLSDEHRHHAFTPADLAAREEVVDWVKRAYSVFLQAAESGSEPDAGALDEIGAALDDADLAYGPVLAQAQLDSEERAKQIEELSAELAEQRVEAERTNSALTEMAGTLTTRDDELRASRADGERVRAELAESRADGERVRAELAESRADGERVRAELAESRADGERVKAELAESRADADRVRAELAANRADADRLKAELAAKGEDLAGADYELARARRGPLKRLRGWFRSASQMASWVVRRPSSERLRYVPTFFSLRRSGAFHYGFYVTRYRDVAKSGLNPLMHYIEHGARDRRDPSPSFSTARYLEQNPEVAEAGINPLLHALRSGAESSSPRLDRPETAAQTLPPPRRPTNDYHEEVSSLLPAGARVLIAHGGHRDLVDIKGLEAVPFPNGPGTDGASYDYPPTDVAGIAHLEALRAQGADFIVLPVGVCDWPARFPGLHSHLLRRYQPVAEPARECIMFSLRHEEGSRPWPGQFEDLLNQHALRFPGSPGVLDCAPDLGIGTHFTELMVIEPPSAGNRLPYLDASIDLVALDRGGSETLLAEARRVARNGLIAVERNNGAVNLSVEWLRDPERKTPSLSIVVPTHNAPGHLQTCLTALAETIPQDLDTEILVVDDASTDGTAEHLSRWEATHKSVRHLRNPENVGFIDSCNLGARESAGEVLVFLNDDTIPLHGWLQALVRTLVDRGDAGAVGGMLLYPDGRLQEAGGMIFSDGSGANFGKGDRDPGAPIYNFVREVDYCSAALLATRRELFEDLGGFDLRYRPGYYEDADYCFRVRDAGQRVYYQPLSRVVHFEGATGGTDLSTGAKKYQEVNRLKFVQRWEDTLELQPVLPTEWTRTIWHELAHRTRPAAAARSHDLAEDGRIKE
jgi:GT2 family glycosyltransferase